KICIYNGNQDVCNYGITIGVIAFLSHMFFITVDIGMELIIHGAIYRLIAAAVLLFNGLWGFLWFVCFCLLTNRWISTDATFKDIYYLPHQVNNAQAAITFSFFLIQFSIWLLGS
ncbi:MARVEL domain-containing protein, partial [Salmonella sp. s54836]|uniref:MARVEL domain-containing protein n=1 Tax=Salmonella sp. s54836 TaxID=3159673 RepID=UPI003981567D